MGCLWYSYCSDVHFTGMAQLVCAYAYADVDYVDYVNYACLLCGYVVSCVVM